MQNVCKADLHKSFDPSVMVCSQRARAQLRRLLHEAAAVSPFQNLGSTSVLPAYNGITFWRSTRAWGNNTLTAASKACCRWRCWPISSVDHEGPKASIESVFRMHAGQQLTASAVDRGHMAYIPRFIVGFYALDR